ncbi:MAG: radical SAM family heme chaperone HemW [Pseudomonadota bacterium]
MARATGAGFGFGIYIHWPYCTRICPYCDFNVYAAKDRDTAPLVAAICADLEAQHARFGTCADLDTVYFGGGTPSLIGTDGLARILETVRRLFGRPAEELTLEANPNDINTAVVADWAGLGVTRLSLGVQSLRDDALAFLGRDHSADDARRAADVALKAFPNTSIDLIYARPGQSLTDWEAELKEALGLGAPHLSLYELTIEERTAFGRRAARGELVAMGDDDQADLYELTDAVCTAAGLPAYEVSNHAAGPAFESQHNHIYWASGDWIGVGPGAHGRLTRDGQRWETQALRRPQAYIEAGGAAREAQIEALALSRVDTVRELIAMGLRPVKGIARARIEALAGPLEDGVLDELESNGVVQQLGGRIALTARGRLLADYVTARLAP